MAMSHPLITSAPAGRHFAQVHKDSLTLAASVCTFVGAGLKRGDRAIIFAVPAHRELIMHQLAESGWNLEVFQASLQLVMLDAQDTLDKFMVDGMPDWKLFRRTITGVLDKKPNVPFVGTRGYGEMVNILWHQGNAKGAIALEDFWNRLQQDYDFSLFCCYTMDARQDACYDHPLHEIGRTHSDVLLTNDDVLFQQAVDTASKEVMGNTLSMTLSLSGREDIMGEHRLPAGQRTILWLKRNMPHIHARVLDRARQVYDQRTAQAM